MSRAAGAQRDGLSTAGHRRLTICRGWTETLQDVMRKVQTRKVRMTMIRVGEAGVERIPVSAAEANELQLRITDDVVAPVIAWSRTRQATAGTSPWFSRTDIIRAWPELSKKTAAVAGALLRHLREISTPEHPL